MFLSNTISVFYTAVVVVFMVIAVLMITGLLWTQAATTALLFAVLFTASQQVLSLEEHTESPSSKACTATLNSAAAA